MRHSLHVCLCLYIYYITSSIPRLISPLACVAVCCSVLQCVVVCCSALQCIAAIPPMSPSLVCCSVLQCVAVCCSALQCVAVLTSSNTPPPLSCTFDTLSHTFSLAHTLSIITSGEAGVLRHVQVKFSKVSAMVILHSKCGSELTFENIYQCTGRYTGLF